MKISMIATGPGRRGARRLGCVGLVSARPQEPVKADAPRPIGADPKSDAARKLTFAAVQAKAVTITQQYVCKIHAHRHIDVQALADGNIAAVPVKEGQAVKRNDLLFLLETLGDDGKPDAEKAEKTVAIKAPFDGIIGRLPRQQGSFVRTGEALTTLSDNSEMWVYFNVPEKAYLDYMAERRQDQESPAVGLLLANRRKYPQPGKIAAIEAEFNKETGNNRLPRGFSEPGTPPASRPDGRGVDQPRAEGRHRHPPRATFEAGARTYVFVVDKDDVAHRREITIKAEVDDGFVVESGIKAGRQDRQRPCQDGPRWR